MIKIEELKCNYENHIINGDHYYNDNKSIATVLLLHGGGLKTTKEKYRKLRIDLLNKGIESYAFNFIGHGESNEDLYSTSLHSKVLQAKTFIDRFINKPFSLIGSSMGGYIVVKLLELYNVSSLILFVPAAYSNSAYDINFGDKFSEIIRKENSWKDSDAFNIINKYDRNVLLISAEDDSVVPIELTNKYRSSFNKKTNVTDYIIKNGIHTVFNYVYDLKEYEDILNLVIKCIKGRH